MVSYRLLTASDIKQLTELVNAQYARKKDTTYFQWQFFASYYPTICMGAFDGEQLIGMFGLQRRQLTSGLAIGHLIDILIASDWRGKGIFRELAEQAFGQFPDLRAYSVLPNTNGKAACEKLGFRTIAKIDDLVVDRKNFHIATGHQDHKQLIRFAIDDAYRAWRFTHNPTYRYQIGAAVTKVFVDPTTHERFGDIVDYDTAASALAASKHFFDEGMEQVSTWALEHTADYPVLSSAGFRALPRERYFCIKTLDPDLDYLYDITEWNLRPADAEIY